MKFTVVFLIFFIGYAFGNPIGDNHEWLFSNPSQGDKPDQTWATKMIFLGEKNYNYVEVFSDIPKEQKGEVNGCTCSIGTGQDEEKHTQSDCM